jgi:hypothetical protein
MRTLKVLLQLTLLTIIFVAAFLGLGLCCEGRLFR